MSEMWHPSTGPQGAEEGSTAGTAVPPGADQYPGLPTPPAGGAPILPAPPYAGPAGPQQWVAVPNPLTAGPGAGAQDPTGRYASVVAGPPTPPAGTWAQSPWPGWGPGGSPGVPPGGGWGGGVPGAPPPGGWVPPGFTSPSPQPGPAKRRHLPMVAVASIAAAAILLGAGVGHLVWSAQSGTNAIASPNSGLPSGSGSSGSGSSPSGSGSSGSGSSPFGSGSSGNSSTGAGAPSDISAIASKVDPGLVDVNTNMSYQNEQAAGTGMVLTSSGEILTNNHVIDGATSISVTDIGNGKTYTANVVGYDRTGDVAVLKLVGASGLQTVTTGTGSAAVGQAVVGVGNAGGSGGTPSAAGGSVIATDQSITASDNGGGNAENLSGLIEINAGIQPGDSGGPLVGTSGQVIGMDTAASTGTGYQVAANQAYAIPIATALSVAGQIESGHASSTVHLGATGFLGVEVASSGGANGSGGFGSGASGSANGTTTSGAVVDGTVSGSPADQAGLAQGDVITAIDGKSISSSSDVSNHLEADHPGDTVQLQWTDQSGQTHTANVKLVNGPAA